MVNVTFAHHDKSAAYGRVQGKGCCCECAGFSTRVCTEVLWSHLVDHEVRTRNVNEEQNECMYWDNMSF